MHDWLLFRAAEAGCNMILFAGFEERMLLLLPSLSVWLGLLFTIKSITCLWLSLRMLSVSDRASLEYITNTGLNIVYPVQEKKYGNGFASIV